MKPQLDKNNFWRTFIYAVGAEPKDASPLRGKSGLSHPIVAIGVDDARKRIIVISGDPDARSAALAQADLQASLPSHKIILARPIGANLAHVAKAVAVMVGSDEVRLEDIKKFDMGANPIVKKIIEKKIDKFIKNGI